MSGRKASVLLSVPSTPELVRGGLRLLLSLFCSGARLRGRERPALAPGAVARSQRHLLQGALLAHNIHLPCSALLCSALLCSALLYSAVLTVLLPLPLLCCHRPSALARSETPGPTPTPGRFPSSLFISVLHRGPRLYL